LLDYLRDRALIEPATSGPVSLAEELVADYERWLVVERGLAPTTVLRYTKLARRFQAERAPVARGVGVVEGLTGAEVVGFSVRECSRVTVGSAKGREAELRALLRFLNPGLLT
jgi:hypothetical protein